MLREIFRRGRTAAWVEGIAIGYLIHSVRPESTGSKTDLRGPLLLDIRSDPTFRATSLLSRTVMRYSSRLFSLAGNLAAARSLLQRIETAAGSPWISVVGMISNARTESLAGKTPGDISALTFGNGRDPRESVRAGAIRRSSASRFRRTHEIGIGAERRSFLEMV